MVLAVDAKGRVEKYRALTAARKPGTELIVFSVCWKGHRCPSCHSRRRCLSPTVGASGPGPAAPSEPSVSWL